MHIQIHDNITLQEIKDIFSDFYPNLKIEFYSTPHNIYEASEENKRLPADKKLREIKEGHLDGVIDIQPTEKVADLEKEFQKRFGLPAQVLRKKKGEWAQTTSMDSFTLREVNEFSKNDSDEFVVEDYEEGFENRLDE